jgi:uncharacterized surface protein with fasciclin (FAS1) repeats
MMTRTKILLLPLFALTATGALAQTAPAPSAPAAQAAPAAPGAAAATPNPQVGGVAMDPSKTIVDNASMAPNLTTLVKLVKAAGLDTTLAGPGPYTVFAPDNDAFSRLPPATLDALSQPQNKDLLTKILSYHVVQGSLTLQDIKTKAGASGTTTLTTVEGDPLTVTIANGAVALTDASGNKSYVSIPDVHQSNGVVHVVNGVVLPKLQAAAPAPTAGAAPAVAAPAAGAPAAPTPKKK